MPELATRQSFLTGCKRRFKDIELSNGQTVRIRSLTEGEQSEYEMSIYERDGAGMLVRDENGNLVRDDMAIVQNRSRLIVMCVVDAEGNRLLTDTDVAQVELMDGADIRWLYGSIQEHLGLLARPEAKKNDSSTNSGATPASS